VATQAVDAAPKLRRAPRVWLARIPSRAGIVALIALLAYIIAAPLVRLQSLALGHGARAYGEAFGDAGVRTSVLTTVELALGSVAIAMVLGVGLAWAASSLSPRLGILRVLPVFPVVVPPIASILGWEFLLTPAPGYANEVLRHLPWWSGMTSGPFDVYTLPWIVIITGLGLSAFVYLFVSAGLENINGELIEAARVCGFSRAGAFFRVTLPLLRPSLVYGGGVALLLGLGQFAPPLLLGESRNINVLTTEMFYKTQLIPPQYDVAAAIGSPLLLFGLVVLFLNRVLLGDHSRFVTHGGKSFRPAARSSKLGALAIIVYFLFATALPVVALVLVSISPFWSGTLQPSRFTLANFNTVFQDPNVVGAIETSLETAGIAVAIALVLGYVAASVIRRRRRYPILSPILDVIVAMPLSIPAVIFGVGFLLTYTHPPLILYGTKWVMVLVYVALVIPFSTRMQLSGMVALGDSYSEASRVSGAGLIKTQLKIIIPLMRSTFGGAAALMFILLANEFSASVLVRSTHVQTMGTILYQYFGAYPFGSQAAIALVMIAVTGAGVVAAIGLSGSEIFKRL